MLKSLLTQNLNYSRFKFNYCVRKKLLTTFRNFHFGSILNVKLQSETENKHAYKILQSIPVYNETLSPNLLSGWENVGQNEFENILGKHWRSETASDIVEAFKKVSHYAKINDIAVSDPRFDQLVDGLMDKCRDLTDSELSELLVCINEFPKPETFTSHNFHDIWSALNDICCSRLEKWGSRTILLFLDHWYLLGLTRSNEFSVLAVRKLCRRVRYLSAAEVVQTLFYINVCRKKWSMFDFELQLEKYIGELSVDELAVVSMGFFKTETCIKGTFLLDYMLKKLLEETKTVNEISLCAIFKIIRYSPHLTLVDKIEKLLTQLIPEIDRLSLLCSTHIALAGTNAQLFHPDVLTRISQKFIENTASARLKDLERLTFALTLFNFNPNNMCQLVLNELRNPERQNEIELYPRCFPSCVHYLGLQQIYPYDLIDRVLDPKFLLTTYGSNKRFYGREILFLDSSVEIDCPDYTGNRLDEKLRNNLAKWSSDWIPYRNQKQRLTASDKFMLDVKETLEVIHGTDDYIHIDYILPHFRKPDIIICKNKNGQPVPVKQYYTKYQIGNVMKPDPKDDQIWYAIVICGWNLNIRGTNRPVGSLNTKMRQLKQIGYEPIMIVWSEYMQLTNRQKEEYLLKQIR